MIVCSVLVQESSISSISKGATMTKALAKELEHWATKFAQKV